MFNLDIQFAGPLEIAFSNISKRVFKRNINGKLYQYNMNSTKYNEMIKKIEFNEIMNAKNEL